MRQQFSTATPGFRDTWGEAPSISYIFWGADGISLSILNSGVCKLKTVEVRNLTKKFLKGFKYPIYPTAEQESFLNRTTGCCRYIWNLVLEETIQEYKHYITQKELGVLNPPKPLMSGYDFINKLPRYKTDPDKAWLNEVSSTALQQTMLHLRSAYSRFFKTSKGRPRFKSRRDRQSFSLTKELFKIKEDKFYIAKCNTPISIHWTRKLPSIPSSITISKSTTGQWSVSFVCEYTPIPTTGNEIIGIDLGLKDFAVLSTSEHISNPKCLVRRERLLRRRQQALSRKQKGSKNHAKAGYYVARIYERTSNSRCNFLHQLSRRLVNVSQVIGLESLNTVGMVKNRCLSKAISDVGWGMFRAMLTYKTIESQHCSLVLMDTFFPSTHLCSTCKTRLDRKLSLKEREWTCPRCGCSHDRDENAALNIRDEAEAVYQTHWPKTDGQILISRTRHLN